MLRDEASLLDIYHAGNQVLSFSNGRTATEIADNEMLFSAILYKFIIIGEATKRLSNEFKASHTELPWSAMAGMRDVLAHQYNNIDIDLLDKAIRMSLPDILPKIKALLPQEP